MNNPSPLTYVSLKCPDCGASLSIEENRKQAFCSYCGAKILIYSQEDLIRAKTDQITREKTLEMQSAAQAHRQEMEKTLVEQESVDKLTKFKKKQLRLEKQRLRTEKQRMLAERERAKEERKSHREDLMLRFVLKVLLAAVIIFALFFVFSMFFGL